MCHICVTLSNQIRNFTKDSNDSIIIRNRKIDIIDSIVYRLLYTQINKSQQNVVSNINMHNDKKVNRSNYIRREASVKLSFYKDLYDIICKFEPKYYNTYTNTIYAVDGTNVNMNIKLKDYNYKPNKNNESITSLILGVYNVTKNYPVTMDLVKHKNERRAFIDFINDKNISKNSIYLFDRGFFSYKCVDKLNEKNLKFVFRIKKDSKLIDNKINDYVKEIEYDYIKYKLRIIKYIINDNSYYLATNLFDENEYSIGILKDLYHKRWTIEEYFKLVKKNMALSKFNEKNETAILKSIYCQLIITHISSLLEKCYNKHNLNNKNKNKNIKINKSNLIVGIYNDFIIHIFYKKTILKYINRFFKIYIVIHNSAKNRSFERTCKTPYHKWYIKRYFKKYLKLNTDDSIT